MKRRSLLRNAASSILSYGFLLLFSIVSSKYILIGYGSETNGLLSSVNQLFSYIALLEAGIGTATVSALYPCIAMQNNDEIGEVLSASRYYYRSSAKWYFLCVVVISFVWPLLLKTEIEYTTICCIIFLQGISGVITYWYTSTIVNYLVASGKNYVNNNIHLFATLLSYLLKILVCMLEMNVVVISASMIGINVVKCLVYHLYIKRSCPEFKIKNTGNKALLAQRNSFLLHEITGVVFSSTDTILLSVFCSLKDASVYAIYALVFHALRQIIGQVFTGTNYTLGNAYSKTREKYARIHDRYTIIYTCIVFAVFTTAVWLILPFLSIYTRGVTDASYLDPKLPLLFVLIELLSACRIVDNQLIKIALHAKQTVSRSVIEAVINLVVSLIAVQFWGIYGVLIGTIAALFYRTNDIILYANKRIMERSALKEYVLYIVNYAVFAGMVWVQRFVDISAYSYMQLISVAIPVCMVITFVYILINLLTFKVYDMIGRLSES